MSLGSDIESSNSIMMEASRYLDLKERIAGANLAVITVRPYGKLRNSFNIAG